MRSLISVLLVLVAGVSALAAATEGFEVVTAEGARRLAVSRQAQPIPNLRLEDAQGRPFDLSALQGKRVVVEFFYTGCQTFCVTMAGSLGTLQNALQQSDRTDVHLLSISFAPGDTADKLAWYRQRVKAEPELWTIARPAGPAQREDLLRAFGVVVIPGEGGEFEHNAALHLLDEQGRLEYIGDFDRPESLAARLGLAPS